MSIATNSAITLTNPTVVFLPSSGDKTVSVPFTIRDDNSGTEMAPSINLGLELVEPTEFAAAIMFGSAGLSNDITVTIIDDDGK